jgi:hypothetical protein
LLLELPPPELVPLGVAVVEPVGVMEPGAVAGVLAVEMVDLGVLGVMVAGLTGATVVAGGLMTGGVIVGGVPGVGMPGVAGLVVDGAVDGLPGMVLGVVGMLVGGAPGAGAWARSREAASDKVGSSMFSPGGVAST